MATRAHQQRLEKWQAALHQNGYRVTQPRLQVMRILANSEIPLTPQDIYQRTLALDSPPGIASVYRTLEMLDDLGLIQNIHLPDGCHSIYPVVEGHKHLLICTCCSQTRVVEGNEGIADYIKRIEEQTSYQVNEHWLQLFGICQECN